jgi:hypothetical protein
LYETTLRNNPEDIHLHNRRRKNLKFHAAEVVEAYFKVLFQYFTEMTQEENIFEPQSGLAASEPRIEHGTS